MLVDSVGAALVLGIGGGRRVPERDTSFRTVLVGIGLSGDTGYEGIEHHACQTGVRGDEGVRERGLSLRVFCAFRMSWHAQSAYSVETLLYWVISGVLRMSGYA